jgi:hypothetical protein
MEKLKITLFSKVTSVYPSVVYFATVCQYGLHTASCGKIIDELEMSRRKLRSNEVYLWNFPGRTEEDHEVPQLQYPV